ncbi:MAG: polymer-forming cytoskeletal protein [Rhodospirillaceae bacterium]|nr:polymer-forming cytoskeletal protein [Rhodospirillaceae bacterium]
MFSKGSKAINGNGQAQDARADIAVKAVPSIISADLSIEGNLNSGGEIQVDGVVNGDIRCKALIVGVKGSVVGEVVAQTVRMHGAIKGLIRSKSVFLASTARMSGEVEHESLAIEPGAYMEGHCKRITESGLAPVEVPRPMDRPMIGASRIGGMPKPAIAAT